MKAILLLLFVNFIGFAQNLNTKELTYDEYLGYVKKFHPMVKSANLEVSAAQANLMMARGGLPKN